MRRLLVAAAMIMGLVMVAAPARAANGWQIAAFSGEKASAVVVNAQHPAEMAVIADSQLQLSHDGGAMWLPSFTLVTPTAISYDPVHSGYIYLGTVAGLYESQDDGLSWQLRSRNQAAYEVITAVVATSEGVFVSGYAGAGTPTHVYRYDADGNATLLDFPGAQTDCFTYDEGSHRLYAGAAGGIYLSDDGGASWRGTGPGAGSYTLQIRLDGNAIWQLSADGLFRSADAGASWTKLVGPGDLNNTYYGSDMRLSGLVVDSGQAFYGDWSFGYPYTFLAEYDSSGARSILNAKVNDVAEGSSRLWAAADDGLWVSDGMALSHPTVRRPVIIVPGIMGSLPTTQSLATYLGNIAQGDWGGYQTPLALDPVGHTYDGLIDYLLARGYKRDQTLFVFPYDWMQDNAVSARQLAEKIYSVRQICGCTQVDVVAHSMGGLVARSYIEGSEYSGDIHALIELGTPNAGAAEVYGLWESGEYQSNLDLPNKLLNLAVQALASPVAASSKAQLVRRYIPAVQQLLPVFDYIVGRHYPDSYPRNPFLSDLNQPNGLALLRQRVAFYAVGSEDHPTLQSLVVDGLHPDATVWTEGAITSQSTGPGDSLVLRSSLEAVEPASLLLPGDHGAIVGQAAPFVAQTLMGGYVDDQAPPPFVPARYLVFYASGPVSLQLTDSKGNQISDTTSTIPGAYYSGSQVSPQLLVVPATDDGHYQINVTASTTGSYSIGAGSIDGTNSDPDPAPSSVTATAVAGQQLTYEYDDSSSEPHLSEITEPVQPSISQAVPAIAEGTPSPSSLAVASLHSASDHTPTATSSNSAGVPRVRQTSPDHGSRTRAHGSNSLAYGVLPLGVLGVPLISLVFWWCRRRRRQS
jgi:photosystem II stability/assembly factor-like uncharacterized protein